MIDEKKQKVLLSEFGGNRQSNLGQPSRKTGSLNSGKRSSDWCSFISRRIYQVERAGRGLSTVLGGAEAIGEKQG